MNMRFERILLLRLYSDTIIKASHPRNIRPPYALKFIQALLAKNDYQVKLIDCATRFISLTKLLDFSLKWRPQIIVVSGTTLEFELAAKYTRALKQQNKSIFIIVIGQDISERPSEYFSPSFMIDFAIRGEPELEVVNLINRINKGEDAAELKAYYRKELLKEPRVVDNLDELPSPFYNPVELDKYGFIYPLKIYKKIKWGHILSSRGCPYDCLFCSQTIRESYGKKIRLRTPQKIADEIESLILNGVNVVSFDDDNFTSENNHIINICQEIIKRKLRISWICHARVDNLSKDLLVLMKEAGCVLLRCGIESGSERILRILKKGDAYSWKQKAEEIFSQARDLDILTDALFLIGNPTETAQDIEESIRLAKHLAPDIIQVAFFTPYPGSPAYKEYKNELSGVPVSQMYHYKYPVINFSRVELGELLRLQKKFYRSFLLNPLFIFKHMRKHSLFYLHNHKVFFELFRGAV